MVLATTEAMFDELRWNSSPGGTVVVASQGSWPSPNWTGKAVVTIGLDAVPMRVRGSVGSNLTKLRGTIKGTLSIRADSRQPVETEFRRHPMHPVDRIFNTFGGVVLALIGLPLLLIHLWLFVSLAIMRRSWGAALYSLFGVLIGAWLAGWGVLAILGYIVLPEPPG